MVRAKVGERAVSPQDAHDILIATRAAGGVERARVKARELTLNALAELGALPSSPFRDAMMELTTASADRTF